MTKNKRVLRAEKSWVLVFAFSLVLLTAIPYLIAANQQGGDFTGFLIGVEDGNSYIAKMLAGAQGDWLFRSPFTSVEQYGALIYLPYILLGKILGSNAQHGSLVLLFHLFRSVSVFVLCFAIYDFVTYFISEVKLRRLALFLITLGGGLGWILIFVGVPDLFGSIPLEFYSPEAFGFLAIFSLPHLVLARALFLWGLFWYLQSRETKQERRGWQVSLLWLALALTHLITAGLGVLLIVVHSVFIFVRKYLDKRKRIYDWQQLQGVIWPVLGVAPVFVFNAWVYWHDSYLRQWAMQNQIRSPNPLDYLVGWGLLLPFAYFGLRGLLKTQWLVGTFMFLWLILLPVLLYAPIGLQRRMSEGAWVMLVVLALLAFTGTTTKKRKIREPRELWLFTLAFPSTLILFLGSLQAAQIVQSPLFRPIDQVKTFDELRQLADSGDIVLSSYETGNALPAWVPVRVVAGHGPESVDLEKLLPRIQAIYQGRTTDDTRLEFFQRYTVDYVFWGPDEQHFGSWLPEEESYLELVVDVGEYKVFRVIEEAIN